jgi:membrane-bound metal-dependent hydrolase YbcI (DUF457 family)
MTQVGHVLTGGVVGVLSTPGETAVRNRWFYFLSLALLANVPDLPVHGWGHDSYRISHSLFVNGLLILLSLAALALGQARRARRLDGRFVAGGVTAWLSHLLLDSMYNHGRGLAMFWPLSEARLALPVPWFSTVRSPKPLTDWATLRVCAIEFAVFGCLLALAIVFRRTILEQPKKDMA